MAKKKNWAVLVVFLAVFIMGLQFLGTTITAPWTTILGWVLTIGGIVGVLYMAFKGKNLTN